MESKGGKLKEILISRISCPVSKVKIKEYGCPKPPACHALGVFGVFVYIATQLVELTRMTEKMGLVNQGNL